MLNVRNVTLSALLIMSGLVFCDTYDAVQIGEYIAPSNVHASSFYRGAKLFHDKKGKYLLMCSLVTRLDSTDVVSQWFFNNMAKHLDTVSCKDDTARFIEVPNFKIRFTKALELQLARFERIIDGKSNLKTAEVFFAVDRFHKIPGGRSYVYVMYANDKNCCYEKFTEIFGQEALEEFKKDF